MPIKNFNKSNKIVIIVIIAIVLLFVFANYLFMKFDFTSEKIDRIYDYTAGTGFVIFIALIIIFYRNYKDPKAEYLKLLAEKYRAELFLNDKDGLKEIRQRNMGKKFIPHPRSFKHLDIIKGKYRNRHFLIYVANKVSLHMFSRNDPHDCLFYEMVIKPFPSYFALVLEKYAWRAYAQFPKLIQLRAFGEKDFLDHDFAAREFNEQWKLRGKDKRLAYQVFDPHLMQILMRIQHKYLIGLEISDQSIILSRVFFPYSHDTIEQDMNILHEICTQIEKNY